MDALLTFSKASLGAGFGSGLGAGAATTAVAANAAIARMMVLSVKRILACWGLLVKVEFLGCLWVR
jgi:hypothetical protein